MNQANDPKKRISIYGKNPVLEALESNQEVYEVWIVGRIDQKLQKIIDLCEKRSIPFFEKDSKSIKFKNHQGVIAYITRKEQKHLSLESFFETISTEEPYSFILLDSITDPRNFGAILRSCDHFNITAVITAQDKSAPITPVVFKTSSGAINYIPLIVVKNLTRSINWLKKQNVWIYGLDIDGDKLISECDFQGNIGIVVGSEGKGMRRLVKESCDFLVSIKNDGHVDSLNVSVATGITLYEIQRQRLK